jgi:hypothetical protein
VNDYPDDFLEARRAYGIPPNDSRKDALKAWNQVEGSRPPLDLLLACIAEYRDFLTAENIKRVRLRQAEHPKCHMATWLRQERWEGFLDAAKARLDRERAVAADRAASLPTDDPAGFWTRLRCEIGEAKFAAWFAGAVYDDEGPRLVIPGAFKRDWISQHFRLHMERAAGGRAVTVQPPPAG